MPRGAQCKLRNRSRLERSGRLDSHPYRPKQGVTRRTSPVSKHNATARDTPSGFFPALRDYRRSPQPRYCARAPPRKQNESAILGGSHVRFGDQRRVSDACRARRPVRARSVRTYKEIARLRDARACAQNSSTWSGGKRVGRKLRGGGLESTGGGSSVRGAGGGACETSARACRHWRLACCGAGPAWDGAGAKSSCGCESSRGRESS